METIFEKSVRVLAATPRPGLISVADRLQIKLDRLRGKPAPDLVSETGTGAWNTTHVSATGAVTSRHRNAPVTCAGPKPAAPGLTLAKLKEIHALTFGAGAVRTSDLDHEQRERIVKDFYQNHLLVPGIEADYLSLELAEVFRPYKSDITGQARFTMIARQESINKFFGIKGKKL